MNDGGDGVLIRGEDEQDGGDRVLIRGEDEQGRKVRETLSGGGNNMYHQGACMNLNGGDCETKQENLTILNKKQIKRNGEMKISGR